LACFWPSELSHSDNYIKANPLVTPQHIVPEWYFLFFYAILRSIPNKLFGVLYLVLSILVLFVIPYLDFSNTHSPFGRPVFLFYMPFFISNLILISWLGGQVVEEPFDFLSQLCVINFFFWYIFYNSNNEPMRLLFLLTRKNVYEKKRIQWLQTGHKKDLKHTKFNFLLNIISKKINTTKKKEIKFLQILYKKDTQYKKPTPSIKTILEKKNIIKSKKDKSLQIVYKKDRLYKKFIFLTKIVYLKKILLKKKLSAHTLYM